MLKLRQLYLFNRKLHIIACYLRLNSDLHDTEKVLYMPQATEFGHFLEMITE